MILREFWNALNARDWDRVADMVEPELDGRWPQSREFVRTRDEFIRFERGYPGDWRIEVVECHEDVEGGATRIAFTLDGQTVEGVTFFRFSAAGRIASFTEFWPEPYEVPPGQEGRLERS